MTMAAPKDTLARAPVPHAGPGAFCHLSSVIYHLSSDIWLVGLGRFERPTSRLSGVRSDQLSYRPPNTPGPKPGPSPVFPPQGQSPGDGHRNGRDAWTATRAALPEDR
jgi:hypothetical protein